MSASEKRLTMADPDRSLPGEEQPVEGAEVVTETPKQELRVKHMVQEWENVLASGEVDKVEQKEGKVVMSLISDIEKKVVADQEKPASGATMKVYKQGARILR